MNTDWNDHDQAVAVITTKLPILLRNGFRSMAHEARTVWAMFLSSIFPVIVDAGPWLVGRIITNTDQDSEITGEYYQ
jgi:hypothetical protein